MNFFYTNLVLRECAECFEIILCLDYLLSQILLNRINVIQHNYTRFISSSIYLRSYMRQVEEGTD